MDSTTPTSEDPKGLDEDNDFQSTKSSQSNIEEASATQVLEDEIKTVNVQQTSPPPSDTVETENHEQKVSGVASAAREECQISSKEQELDTEETEKINKVLSEPNKECNDEEKKEGTADPAPVVISEKTCNDNAHEDPVEDTVSPIEETDQRSVSQNDQSNEGETDQGPVRDTDQCSTGENNISPVKESDQCPVGVTTEATITNNDPTSINVSDQILADDNADDNNIQSDVGAQSTSADETDASNADQKHDAIAKSDQITEPEPSTSRCNEEGPSTSTYDPGEGPSTSKYDPQQGPSTSKFMSQIIKSVIKSSETLVNSPQSSKENDVNEQSDSTEFVHVNEKEENKEDASKVNDEILQDPIGGDENDAENTDSMAEGADEELCIIPDTQRVLSQAEKNAACNLSPTKIPSTSSNDEAESNPNVEETQNIALTVIKYKDKNPQTCYKCGWVRTPKYEFKKMEKQQFLCNDDCLEDFKTTESGRIVLNWDSEIRVKDLTPKSTSAPFKRTCASCKKKIQDVESNLTWEIMDFCNETCLTKYQKEIGSKCSNCRVDVKANSLGKYCVRFGNDIRQFCTSNCLEKFKKVLKVCSYCQLDMSTGSEGFLDVGDKGIVKDFCSRKCLDNYDTLTNKRPPRVIQGTKCCVCKLSKPITNSFKHNGTDNYFCSERCFVAFSFVNSIKSDKCAMCQRNFSKETLEKHTMFYENAKQSFCSNSCQNIYIIAHRKIVPCTWCKVKKYNFDMIRRFNANGSLLNMCSVNCMNLYRVSLDAVASKKTQCDFCKKNLQAMYHLTMSDATMRNFCTYACVMAFQGQFNKSPITLAEDAFPVPTGTPKRSKRLNKASETITRPVESTLPVISRVQSLANNGTMSSPTRTTRSRSSTATPPPQPPVAATPIPLQSNIELPVQVKHHILVQPASIPEQRNVATMCRPRMCNKGLNAIPKVEDAQVQTEKREAEKVLIPVPVPIFVPLPMHMFAAPIPMPVPIPIPVPVPVFIPTTRNSANGIMKEIKKIQVKIPTNPYEAELLMMAEMVADDKKEENTDSESDVEDTVADDTGGGSFSPEPQDGSNTFGDDMLQMALKMATELDEPAVDLEGALTANTITASQTQEEVHHPEQGTEEVSPEQLHLMDRGQRGRKRPIRGSPRQGTISKRGRRSLSHHVDMPMMQQPPPPPEPQEKPDANMCLKYTFGVNAWKQWVTFKNAELEKSSRRVKLFKTEILQLTADELNYSLCLFVKEVRKPNGAEYAPDTIYYLCLGIQQYLFENGRIDNIFCDAYYEKFTDCLDEVAKKFSVLYNDSHYIVTRVEEEHLWESKQLGAHSPHVLLSTLMFFNTKHFNLTTVDEHMQLSFSHIMKHWKRNPNQAGASKIPGSRNVLLRFYPPQSAIQNNSRKKKVYEQQENEENPLRCPVKLYEFYLSKCPESVKTRNDVFYLQPERSCVPDSPVWYSTMPLPRDALEKMLHRVKMVKEINVALLTS